MAYTVDENMSLKNILDGAMLKVAEYLKASLPQQVVVIA